MPVSVPDFQKHSVATTTPLLSKLSSLLLLSYLLQEDDEERTRHLPPESKTLNYTLERYIRRKRFVMTRCKLLPLDPGLPFSSLKILNWNVCLGRAVSVLCTLVLSCTVGSFPIILQRNHGTFNESSITP